MFVHIYLIFLPVGVPCARLKSDAQLSTASATPVTPTPSATFTPVGTRYNRYPTEAERLGICVRSLASLVAEKKVPIFKIGKIVLFDPVAVDAALSKYRVAYEGEPRPPKRRMERIAQEQPA